MSNKNLSEQETLLFGFMNTYTMGTDVGIDGIYVAVFGDTPNDTRVAQQRLGSVVSKVNRKRTDCKIEPGALKRTYRLVAIPAKP